MNQSVFVIQTGTARGVTGPVANNTVRCCSLGVHSGILSVPFVQCWFSAISYVFISLLRQYLLSSGSSAPFPRCSFWYLLGVFLVSDIDIPSLPHLVFQSGIVSIRVY